MHFISLMVSIDENGKVIIYIDSAHTAHNNSKEHSGLYLMIEKKVIINVSKKLSLVTTSSIEIEITADSKRFLKCSWFQYFCLG